jgi:hypothetical protein
MIANEKVSDAFRVKESIANLYGCWLCLKDAVSELPVSALKQYLIFEFSNNVESKDIVCLYQLKYKVSRMMNVANEESLGGEVPRLLVETRDTIKSVIKYLENGGEF